MGTSLAGAGTRAMPAGALEAAAKDQEVDLEPSVDGWFARAAGCGIRARTADEDSGPGGKQ